MANSSPVYDPETESGGEPTYRTPPDLGPGHDRAAGDSSDPRGDLRRAETSGSQSGTSGSSNLGMGSSDTSGGSGGDGENFSFNPEGDDKRGGAIGSAGLAARELAYGGGVAGAATTALGGARNLFLGSKRRKQASIGGGLAGGLIIGLILVLAAASGPAELTHLSHILQRSLGNSQNASSNRLDKIYRFATARDMGETRIGYLGRKVVRPQIEQLNDLGISFDLNKVAGINGTTIDTDKLAEKYPELKDIPEAERGRWLADNVFSNVAAAGGEFQQQEGGVYKIDRANSDLKSLSFDQITADDAFGELDDNGVKTTALNLRYMSKYLNIPSGLFHPLSRRSAQKLRDAMDNAKNRTQIEKETIQEGEQSLESGTADSPEAKSASDNIEEDKNGFGIKGSLVNALGVVGGACFAQSTAHEIQTVNRDRVALPAVTEALHFMSIGEQIENGSDTSMTQVEAIGKSLISSSGQAIWSAQGLQALAGDNQHNGTDLPADYRQAFLGSGVANAILAVVNPVLSKIPVPGSVGGPCGTIGTIGQLVITLGASAASVIAEVGTAGFATPAVGGWWAAEQGSNIAETAMAMHFIQGFVLDSTTNGKLAKDAFSGPLGGNLLAYGARYGADISGAAEGLVPLSGSNSSAVSYQQEQQSRQQFASEGLFARMFDINDYRSLTGHLADSLSPSMLTNFADGASNFGNIGNSLLSDLSSIFLPKSLATPQPYNWGFPLFGLPSNMANTTDRSLANPYTNADKVAALLDSSSGQSYRDKASSCFGVDIKQTPDDSGNDLWDVVPRDKPIDMTSGDYQSQDCGNTGDPNWQRMILFVLDTRTMEAAACWAGDDESCQNIGYGSAAEPGVSDSATPTSTADATIDMDHLYDSSVDVACAPNTKDLGVQDGYYQGKKVSIRTCAISNMPSTASEASNGLTVANSRVSGALYAIAEAAKKAGLNPTTSSGFRSMQLQECLVAHGCGYGGGAVAPAGYSNHQMGLAIDVSDPSSFNTWMRSNGEKFGYKWYGAGDTVHFSPTGN